ncbi:MAG: hypothetical protein HQL88_00405 [Magnetococcales bacterium]|nr:hypothetical protein [Magnetococcales bacterium]
MEKTVRRATGVALRLLGVALAGAMVTLPRAAHAEWFWENWFGGPAAEQAARRSGSGLAVYGTPSPSWAHLPSIVYASVPTVDGRYPVPSQHAAVGMPVQTVPLRPVVVQTRPGGVYGGNGE